MSWKFRTYTSPAGRNDVQKAIAKARAAVITHFSVAVRYLANTPKIDWKEPDAKKLTGVKDIYEIRFKAEKKQYRPLGFFGPRPGEFTITVWATHKQNIYDPQNAIETAGKRRDEIIKGPANTSPLTIDGEEFPPP
jgi:hypothetical protein